MQVQMTGGVSPVGRDHVNPEAPWPGIEELRRVNESGWLLSLRRGFQCTGGSSLRSSLSPLVLDKINELYKDLI